MQPLTIKLLLMLCKIDKYYFIYVKAFMFSYRDPLLKKINPQYHEENNHKANTTQTFKIHAAVL